MRAIARNPARPGSQKPDPLDHSTCARPGALVVRLRVNRRSAAPTCFDYLSNAVSG